MIRLFEITVMLLAILVLLISIKKRVKPVLLVAATATVTIMVGEWINAHVTQVTIYNREFSLWLPDQRVPVCIIVAGVLLTLVIYAVVIRLIDSVRKSYPYPFVIGILALLISAMALPILERTCMSLGLWEWQRPSDFTIFWYVGVYKFYFIHMASAVIPGIWLRERIHRGDFRQVSEEPTSGFPF